MRNNKKRYRKKEVLGVQGKSYCKKNKKGLISKIFKKMFLIVLIFFCYWFFVSGAMSTKEYHFQIDDKAARDLVEKQISLLENTFVSRNFYIFSEKKIKRHLISSLPQLKNIKVDKDWRKRIFVISAQPKSPLFILKYGRNYVLDREGVVLGLRQEENLPFIIINGFESDLSVGEKPIDKRIMFFLNEIISYQYMIESEVTEFKFLNKQKKDLEITTEKGYRVFLDTDRSAKNQLEVLNRILNEISRSNGNPIEYIDLRIEDKIFFR